MKLTIRLLQEEDGRWLGIVDVLPGVMAYGASRDEATAKTQALAYWRIADMLDAGELPSADHVEFERAA
jgi:predicted RNase H-like HicB family nuclease